MNRLRLLFLLCVAAPIPVAAQTPVQNVKAGEAALERDDYPRAEQLFDRVLESRPNSPALQLAAYHGRGMARWQLHKWSDAKDDLSRAIALDPRDAAAFMARAMTRKALGDSDGFLSDAAQAARLNPQEYSDFQSDAQSTVLYRRIVIGFGLAACALLLVGAFAFGRTLLRLMRAGA